MAEMMCAFFLYHFDAGAGWWCAFTVLLMLQVIHEVGKK